jgi:precorrin-6B C5,15-methyltransferase / cobalt-precorrin-6B C5,C15-methyltransferase
MADPWLAIVGVGEDGLAGLSAASRAALEAAEVVFGGPRHLDLVQAGDRGRPWPVPFDAGPVLSLRGRRVAVLASGDPFWHGAGGTLAAYLSPGEWTSHPAPSTFSLAASRLGWRLEETVCLGLHAAPFARARPHLAAGARLILTLRDGAAVAALAAWLADSGFKGSALTIFERLGGPAERQRRITVGAPAPGDIDAPVAVALEVRGGDGLPRSPGLPEHLFAHDGQITKSAIRALSLAALAPRPGEMLWDLGAGSGSVAVEWCLAGGRAQAVEARADRAANVAQNARAFGIDHRLTVTAADWPAALPGLPPAAAVFVGGGLTAAALATLWDRLEAGTRLVANAVTLETEALLIAAQAANGGALWRYDVAKSGPLGPGRGWEAARPVVQWAVTR